MSVKSSPSNIACLFAMSVCALFIQTATGADTAMIEQRALTLFERAITYLSRQAQFSAGVEVWEDVVFAAGTKLQAARTIEFNVRRPDRFRVEVATVVPFKRFYYNGENVTLVDEQAGFFGVATAPPSTDEVIAKMEQTYGVTFPLDDLLLNNPYAGAAEKADSGQYLGVQAILGKRCHHLAFQHETIDWQAWIWEGPQPVLCKLAINYKLEDGSPQFIALFNSWDFETELPDYLFEFEPAPGFRLIEFVELSPGSAPESQ